MRKRLKKRLTTTKRLSDKVNISNDRIITCFTHMSPHIMNCFDSGEPHGLTIQNFLRDTRLYCILNEMLIFAIWYNCIAFVRSTTRALRYRKLTFSVFSQLKNRHGLKRSAWFLFHKSVKVRP